MVLLRQLFDIAGQVGYGRRSGLVWLQVRFGLVAGQVWFSCRSGLVWLQVRFGLVAGQVGLAFLHAL